MTTRPTGQARYLADDLPATPGQHRVLAQLAAEWLGLGPIDTAIAATVAAARLRLALGEHGPGTAPAGPVAAAVASIQDVAPAQRR
jgi:hypothetical protein